MKKIILIGLLITVLLASTEKEVQILTDDNFESFIQQNSKVLVKFYAPWCGHCQQMVPEYLAAAKQLQKEGSNIQLAKVDCTQHKKLAEKYKISGYPTLIFFYDGLQIEYKNGRTQTEILEWLKKKTGPISFEVKSNEALEKIKQDNEIVAIYFGINENDENFKIFNKVASNVDGIPYVHTFNKEIATLQQVSTLPFMIIYKQYDEPRNEYIGAWNQETVTWFIKNQQIPSIMNFDEKSAALIFEQEKTTLFLITKDDQDSQNLYNQLEQVKEDLKDKIVICRARFSDELGQRLSEFLGLNEMELPIILIMAFSGNDINKYHLLKKQIDKQDILSFYDDFVQNKLQPVFKSEPIPKQNDKPVKIIVGKTFNQLVLKSETDVLLEFYASWCGHCQEFEPEYEKLAEKFQNQDIIIAKIEATENEVEGLSSIEGYPTLRFYKKGNKQNPIEYTGDKTFSALKLFLEQNMSLYLYGGYEFESGILSEFLYLNMTEPNQTKQWQIMHQDNKDESPGNLCRHSSGILENIIYIFGGQQTISKISNNLHTFNLETKKWTLIQNNIEIPQLESQTMSINYQDKQLIIFGGFNISGYSNDLLIFNTSNNLWKKANLDKNKNKPLKRAGHAAVYVNNYLYIFGGTNGVQKMQDLWKFNLISQHWEQIQQQQNSISPCLRSGHTLNLYQNRYLILFGGIQYLTQELNDLYIYDISANQWHLIDTASSKEQQEYHNKTSVPQLQIKSQQDKNLISHIKSNKNANIQESQTDRTYYSKSTKKIRFQSPYHYLNINQNKLIKLPSIASLNNTPQKQRMQYEQDEYNLQILQNSRNNISKQQIQKQSSFSDLQRYKSNNNSHHYNNQPFQQQSLSKTGLKNLTIESKFDKTQNTSEIFQFSEFQFLNQRKQQKNYESQHNQLMRHNVNQDDLNSLYHQYEKAKIYPLYSKQEKIEKLKDIKKKILLTEFQKNEFSEQRKNELKTPITQAMRMAILALGKRTNLDHEEDQSQKLNENIQQQSLNKSEIVIHALTIYDNKILNKKPQPRDGHSSCIYGDVLIIMGGDRHKLSFNEIFECDLKKIEQLKK